jgi:hypothetical protein
MPVPVATQSKAYVYGRSSAAIVGSNHTRGMDVCLLCVLWGRGLCDELISHPEESYLLWCVIVCDLETSCKLKYITELLLQIKVQYNLYYPGFD